MEINLKDLEKQLLGEKASLESELSNVGRKNPDSPSGWEALPPERDVSQADENTVADGITDYEENRAIVATLEARLKDVVSGLDKLKKGVFGKCQVCQKPIEEDRLGANPAARTCKEHMN